MKALLCGVAATLAFGFATSASAITVDMQSLPSGNCAFLGASVTTQGFTFATQTPGNNLFACNGNINSQDPTRNLVDANGLGDVLMTAADSSPFSIQSVGAASRSADFNVTAPSVSQGALGFTVTGFLVGGGSVSQTFNFSGLSYGIFTLSGFENLSSARFTAFGTTSAPEFALDDITVNEAVAVVPEPGTWALMLLGFGALGATLRRSRAVAA